MKTRVEVKTILSQDEDGRWRLCFLATQPEAGKALRELFSATPPQSLVLRPDYPTHPGRSQGQVYAEIIEAYE